MAFNLVLFYVAWDMRKLKDINEPVIKKKQFYENDETGSRHDSGKPYKLFAPCACIII